MKDTNWFFILIFTLSAAVIINNFYLFYYQKNYKMTVEASCDPALQTCFIRDCSEEDSCPPNQLAEYRVFEVNASDFAKCSDDSCLNECVSNSINCSEIQCGDSKEDTCSIFSTELEQVPVVE